MEPSCEQNAVRESEQPVPSTSWRTVTTSPRHMLFGLRYVYLLVDVDETIANRTEASQLLNCATGDVSSVTKQWSDRWLRKRGSPKGGYGRIRLGNIKLAYKNVTSFNKLAGSSYLSFSAFSCSTPSRSR